MLTEELVTWAKDSSKCFLHSGIGIDWVRSAECKLLVSSSGRLLTHIESTPNHETHAMCFLGRALTHSGELLCFLRRSFL